ncbi:MAG TPA: ATP-grasp domain-containing protein, partial [Acidimicrobiales bacterium]|nr:ATP-grasp domain-containing protein [Acidimicrobiales bacterium]
MDRYLRQPGAAAIFDRYVDDIVFCDTARSDDLWEAVESAHRKKPLTAFMSMAEYEVVDAALVAERLQVPGPARQAVLTARNKVFMRQACAAAKLPMPEFRAVASAAAAADAARQLGFPCVVKPADETSSALVRRCHSVEQAVEQYVAITSEPLNIRGQPRYPEVLVEECIIGYEVSVEVLAERGRYVVLGVTDKQLGGTDRFVELGHLFPSMLPQLVQRAAEALAVDALTAVGFDLGLAHVEIKHGNGGPKLIEVNPRPAGDRITDLVTLSLGIDCLELVVRQYLGRPLGPLPGIHASRGAAIRFLTAPPGEVQAVMGRDVAERVDGVVDAVVSVGPGDLVGALLRNEDRVGHVLAVGETAYVASRVAEAAAHEIVVATRRAAGQPDESRPQDDRLESAA